MSSDWNHLDSAAQVTALQLWPDTTVLFWCNLYQPYNCEKRNQVGKASAVMKCARKSRLSLVLGRADVKGRFWVRQKAHLETEQWWGCRFIPACYWQSRIEWLSWIQLFWGVATWTQEAPGDFEMIFRNIRASEWSRTGFSSFCGVAFMSLFVLVEKYKDSGKWSQWVQDDIYKNNSYYIIPHPLSSTPFSRDGGESQCTIFK